MRRITLFVLFCHDTYRDVFASYSEAMREKHPGDCCRIDRVEREEY